MSALLAAPNAVRADDRLRFRRITVESGLTNSHVRAILKDSRGFVWFATDSGLNRYDGVAMAVYRHQPGAAGTLASSLVVSLFEDRHDRMWLGMGQGGGLALYDREADRFENVAFPPGALSPWTDVYRVLEDSRGRFWVAVTSGLYLLNPVTRVATLHWQPTAVAASTVNVTARFASTVWNVVEDGSGGLWLGTEYGVYRFDPENGTAARVPLDGREGPAARPSSMRAFYVDEAGALWCAEFATPTLFRFDPRSRQTTHYLPASQRPGGFAGELVMRLAGDRKGHVFIGTDDAGLDVLDVATGQFTQYAPDLDDPASLGSHSIWAIDYDDQDCLWVGTYDAGIAVASPYGQRFGLLQARPGGLSNSHVTAVVEDQRGALWVGTDGGGLNRYDPASATFTYYRHDSRSPNGLLSDAVLALCESRDGTIWVGTWAGGLQALDPATGRFTSYRHDPSDPSSLASRHVSAILEDSQGRLLVAAWGAGIQVLDRKTGRFADLSTLHPGAGDTRVSFMMEAAGELWIASTRVVHVDRTGRVTPYALDAGQVAGVFADSRGTVWFATERGGLQYLDATARSVRRITTADGLPTDNVASLSEDGEGNLWLGTTRGLVKFTRGVEPPHTPRFVVFDARDGLQGDEFRRGAFLKSRAGELFFGGQSGLSFFFPGKIALNPRPPRVAVTSVRAMSTAESGPAAAPRRLVPGEREIVLSADDAMITFEFAALDFSLPLKSRYSYRLEGFSEEWSPPASDRAATYTNLPPGSFRFRVRASNGDGVWNEQGASLRVRRVPRFTETLGFRVAVAMGLLAAGFGLHRARLLRHVLLERELEARFNEARARLKTLTGLLPICAWCKKVRDDGGYWSQIETYMKEHSEALVAEGFCPDCTSRTDKTTAAPAGAGR